GGVELPVQDLYAKLVVPRLLGHAIRLDIRPSYTWEILRYYGLGNAAVDATRFGATRDFVSYRRLHPQLEVDVRGRIVDHLALLVGLRYTQNWLQTTPTSELVADQQAGNAEVRSLVGSFAPHGVLLLKTGLQFDNRDNELSTHTGHFHELNLKVSPGGSDAMPYAYTQINFIARVFIPLSNPTLTLAIRLVGDVIFGDAPFYELTRFEDTYALGGSAGVRGVPAQRYYGKAKLFGNVELRAELAHFHALGKPLIFGVVGYFDGGRVWADTQAEPTLDGSGFGLKYGTGLGVRVQSGSAFVLRASVAWSPDANPISGYFSAGQMF
ncbi:MAG: BamA/TamA family outer membrane protein, partial [Polyangiales bacterium]